MTADTPADWPPDLPPPPDAAHKALGFALAKAMPRAYRRDEDGQHVWDIPTLAGYLSDAGWRLDPDAEAGEMSDLELRARAIVRLADRVGYVEDEMVRGIMALVAEQYRDGRLAAARDVERHADEWAPRDGNEHQRRMRRCLMIAARVAAPEPTPAEIVEALRGGDYAVCHLDEAGRSVRSERPEAGEVRD